MHEDHVTTVQNTKGNEEEIQETSPEATLTEATYNEWLAQQQQTRREDLPKPKKLIRNYALEYKLSKSFGLKTKDIKEIDAFKQIEDRVQQLVDAETTARRKELSTVITMRNQSAQKESTTNAMIQFFQEGIDFNNGEKGKMGKSRYGSNSKKNYSFYDYEEESSSSSEEEYVRPAPKKLADNYQYRRTQRELNRFFDKPQNQPVPKENKPLTQQELLDKNFRPEGQSIIRF